MARYVPDIHTKRWVVIAPKRLGRPDQHKEQDEKKCPFCVGNEHMTPPETYRAGNGKDNEQGWEVRVVPNLYSITDTHEVIIHSTDHLKDIEELGIEQNIKILTAFKDRFNYYRKSGQVLIFTNHGKTTGASQIHPHSQLVVIPHQIKLDTLELEPKNNLILENVYFSIFCPEFSQWPYEVWIAPERKNCFFGDITNAEIQELAINLKLILNKLKTIFLKPNAKNGALVPEFAYNLYIYPLENWYLRIIPRLMIRAGFELGTGISLNIVDPSDASEEIKSLIL